MKIIYEDRHILVCEKEAGIPVQSASVRVKTLTDEVRAHLCGADVWVVHRLDQPVCGLVVYALDARCAAALSAQVGAGTDSSGKPGGGRQMEKTYLALVRCRGDAVSGKSARTGGTDDVFRDGNLHMIRLEHMLLKDPKTNLSRVVSGKTKGAKKAALEYGIAGSWNWDGEHGWTPDGSSIRDPEAFEAAGRIFACHMQQEAARFQAQQDGAFPPAQDAPGKGAGMRKDGRVRKGSGTPAEEDTGQNGRERLTALRIRLLTGRHHQIRVQLSAAGMPILGDHKYAGPSGNTASAPAGDRQNQYGFPALCAWQLALVHPADGRKLTFRFQEHHSFELRKQSHAEKRC